MAIVEYSLNSDDESSVDNELQSDYDISSDNISDNESESDEISLTGDILSDDTMSDEDIKSNSNDEKETNIRIIKSTDDNTNLIDSNTKLTDNSNSVNTKSIVLNITKNNKQSKRNTPNEHANKFEKGHVMISDNDNRKYRVLETKTGVKRWILHKN